MGCLVETPTATLRFEEATHTYWLDNERLTSVTQLLIFQDFSNIPKDILEYKCQLGTYVHKAIELFLLGELDQKTLHPKIAEYFNSWLIWWEEHKSRITVLGIEERFYHPVFKYAGCVDLRCEYDGEATIIDWKCASQHSIWYGLQTAGYQIGCTHYHQSPIKRRGALIIGKDNKCTMHWHENANDAPAFTGLLNIHNWRLNHEHDYAAKCATTH